MNKYLQTDVEGLVKDAESGAVLNIDHVALDAYKKKKNFYKSHQNEQKRIDRIEDDVAEIKQMLQQLLKRS
jgi:uncharacterized protein YceH (UPF0502 family)